MKALRVESCELSTLPILAFTSLSNTRPTLFANIDPYAGERARITCWVTCDCVQLGNPIRSPAMSPDRDLHANASNYDTALLIAAVEHFLRNVEETIPHLC